MARSFVHDLAYSFGPKINRIKGGSPVGNLTRTVTSTLHLIAIIEFIFLL